MTPREMDKDSREKGKEMMKDDALTSLKKSTALHKKKSMAKNIVGMKDLNAGKNDANRAADSQPRVKADLK